MATAAALEGPRLTAMAVRVQPHVLRPRCPAPPLAPLPPLVRPYQCTRQPWQRVWPGHPKSQRPAKCRWGACSALSISHTRVLAQQHFVTFTFGHFTHKRAHTRAHTCAHVHALCEACCALCLCEACCVLCFVCLRRCGGEWPCPPCTPVDCKRTCWPSRRRSRPCATCPPSRYVLYLPCTSGQNCRRQLVSPDLCLTCAVADSRHGSDSSGAGHCGRTSGAPQGAWFGGDHWCGGLPRARGARASGPLNHFPCPHPCTPTHRHRPEGNSP